MILLLGGTSEALQIVRELTEAGYKVLLSTATAIDQNEGEEFVTERRTGPLDEEGLAVLIKSRGIKAIVDCTHPYASGVRASAPGAAKDTGIPYFTYIRPVCIPEGRDIVTVRNHYEAAQTAFSFGQPVLLTTGSRNLDHYVQASRHTGLKLVVRVLPEMLSLDACEAAGISRECIITGRGPFSVEMNRDAIKAFGIGVIVTKDSGIAGGVPEKLEAARQEKCRIVVVRRPEQSSSGAYGNMKSLISAIIREIPASCE
ncbi:MAG: Cobalt-precorrin-6A reductase [Syntrophus sp. SKADARSKE-3]|nr:Cobalt-precorrin-6A reductase [Syntrophus sp. SKADARSKE-3]